MMTCCQNTLKLTNQHVEIQKLSPGLKPPDHPTPLKGMGSRGNKEARAKIQGRILHHGSSADDVPAAVYTSAMSASGTLKNVLKTS